MQKFVYLTLAFIILMGLACITVVQPGATSPGNTATVGNKPAAFIDRISPSNLNWGESVSFSGHGTAATGSITAYRWRSSIDGDLSNMANFDTTQLSPGKHIVLFSVQDSSGNWSQETQGTVNLITEAVPGTADTDAPPVDSGSGTPTPTPPVINSFNAAPANITAGSTSTLSWDVGNAMAVTIDHGVGSMSLTGTKSISPATDTMYTLTAANAAYFSQATVQVTVAAAAAPKSDLIIEDIWKSGDKMYYRIRNQGTSASPVTWSELRVDGVVKAQDAVAALAAGASATRSFAGYTYACTGMSDSVTVTADTTNAAVESNEGNNSLTKSFSCLVLGPVVPPLVLLRPDLTITQISFLPAPLNRVSYTVKNVGSLNAGAFDVKLYVSGAVKDTDHVAGLASGATAYNTFPFYHHICVLGSLTTVKVVADSGGAITESDETNNSRSEFWGCPP